MTDQKTIQAVSEQMQAPPLAGDGQDHFADELVTRYPYFIPARYIRSAIEHGEKPFSAAMLSEIYPYLGNWLLFCDYIDGVKAAPETETHIWQPANNEISTTEDMLSQVIDTDEPLHSEKLEEVTSGNEYVLPGSMIELEETPSPEAYNKWVENDTEQEMLFTDLDAKTASFTLSDELIAPVYTEDYFMQQGVKISPELSESVPQPAISQITDDEEKEKALMVMMSFTEWLLHFRNTAERQQSEKDDKKAIRTMWQKEKLAAAMEEENDEIPENVFEMAVNSITSEDGLASESLAEIYTKQQKYDKAVEMYRKLSLRNPQKSAYFARKIEEVLKEKQL